MERLRVDTIDALEARALLRRCCGSSRWIEAMMRRRPFGTSETLQAAAGEVWSVLQPEDWLEAFAAHPRIGDRTSLEQRFPDTHLLSAREQAGVDGVGDDVLTALAEGNAAYEKRFGFIFIVCATGLTAAEMLGVLQARLKNDPAAELRIAAGEQAKITALRLKGM